MGAPSPRRPLDDAPPRSRADEPPEWVRRLTFPGALVTLDATALVGSAVLLGSPTVGTVVTLLTVLGLFAAGGLYRARLTLSVLDDLPTMLGRALVGGAVLTVARALPAESAVDLVLLRLSLLFVLAAAALRGLAYAVLRRLRARGVIRHNTLVIGGGRVGAQLATILQEHREYGLTPLGFLDDDPQLADDERPVPHLGPCRDLARVIERHDVGNVVVAFSSVRESAIVDVLRTCDRLDCEIFTVPRLYELSAVGREVEFAWGIPLVRLRRAAFRSPLWKLKRALDVLLAGLALVLAAPVLALCAVAVWLEAGSPVLFRQERVGLDGRPFRLYKFCSLRPSSGEEATWTIAGDGRIGPVGRFLRRTSLDELPQLWNIVRGDMSLVGPRPERALFVEQFATQYPRYTHRHRVPVGLTGWAQVHGLRGDTSIADRASFDNHYIENWSLWADCKIILRTLGSVVRAAGR